MKLFYTRKETGSIVYKFNGKKEIATLLEPKLEEWYNELLIAFNDGNKDVEADLQLVYKVLNYGWGFVNLNEVDHLMAKYGYSKLPYSYPYQRKYEQNFEKIVNKNK